MEWQWESTWEWPVGLEFKLVHETLEAPGEWDGWGQVAEDFSELASHAAGGDGPEMGLTFT